MEVYIKLPNNFIATIRSVDELEWCFKEQTGKVIPKLWAREVFYHALRAKKQRINNPKKQYPVAHFTFKAIPTLMAVGRKPRMQIFSNQAWRNFGIIEVKKTKIRVEMDFPSGPIGSWVPAINYQGSDYFLNPLVRFR